MRLRSVIGTNFFSSPGASVEVYNKATGELLGTLTVAL